VAVDRVRALELLDRDLDAPQLVVETPGVLEREQVLRVGVEARLPGGERLLLEALRLEALGEHPEQGAVVRMLLERGVAGLDEGRPALAAAQAHRGGVQRARGGAVEHRGAALEVGALAVGGHEPAPRRAVAGLGGEDLAIERDRLVGRALAQRGLGPLHELVHVHEA
jgi:hypothetical protein